jgi:hypothetical protein
MDLREVKQLVCLVELGSTHVVMEHTLKCHFKSPLITVNSALIYDYISCNKLNLYLLSITSVQITSGISAPQEGKRDS